MEGRASGSDDAHATLARAVRRAQRQRVPGGIARGDQPPRRPATGEHDVQTVTIFVVVLALAVVGALALAGRSARAFMQEKKKRQGSHPFAKLPGPGAHGKRARKK
jgi:hypothetical protein